MPNPFDEGYVAGVRGEVDNPYSVDGNFTAWDEWEKGWAEGTLADDDDVDLYDEPSDDLDDLDLDGFEREWYEPDAEDC